MSKRRKKRAPRTPDQVALGTRTVQEAQQKGIDVHRAYMQQAFESLSPEEKKIVNIIMDKLLSLPNEEAVALMERFTKNASEAHKVIEELTQNTKGESNEGNN